MKVTLCDMIYHGGENLEGHGPEKTCSNVAYYAWRQPRLGNISWGVCPRCYHSLLETGSIEEHELKLIVPIVRYAGKTITFTGS